MLRTDSSSCEADCLAAFEATGPGGVGLTPWGIAMSDRHAVVLIILANLGYHGLFTRLRSLGSGPGPKKDLDSESLPGRLSESLPAGRAPDFESSL